MLLKARLLPTVLTALATSITTPSAGDYTEFSHITSSIRIFCGKFLNISAIEEGRRQRAEGRRFNLEGDSNPS